MLPVADVSGVLMSAWASTQTTLSSPTAAAWPWMEPMAKLTETKEVKTAGRRTEVKVNLTEDTFNFLSVDSVSVIRTSVLSVDD